MSSNWMNAAMVLALSGTAMVLAAKGRGPISVDRLVSGVLSNPVPARAGAAKTVRAHRSRHRPSSSSAMVPSSRVAFSGTPAGQRNPSCTSPSYGAAGSSASGSTRRGVDRSTQRLTHAPEPADEHVYEAHEEVYEGDQEVEDDPEYLHQEVRDVIQETRRAEDNGEEQYHRYGHQRSAHDASPPPRSTRSYSGVG